MRSPLCVPVARASRCLQVRLNLVLWSCGQFGGQVEIVVNEHVNADPGGARVLKEDDKRRLALPRLELRNPAVSHPIFSPQTPEHFCLRQTQRLPNRKEFFGQTFRLLARPSRHQESPPDSDSARSLLLSEVSDRMSSRN